MPPADPASQPPSEPNRSTLSLAALSDIEDEAE